MRKADTERKMRSAEKLFDAIGMIDDRIIADAAEVTEYYSKTPTRKRTFLRRYAVSLTALLLVFMMVGGFVVANLSNVIHPDSSNEAFRDNMEDNSETQKTLDFVLSNATTNEKTAILSLDEIDFFDGKVSLIWNYGGEDEYNKLTFEAKNADSEIKNCMSKSVEQIPADSADATICRVWVSYGNGEVVSPYLKHSAGNIGYATLLDYSREVVPSDSFCDLVNDALIG